MHRAVVLLALCAGAACSANSHALDKVSTLRTQSGTLIDEALGGPLGTRALLKDRRRRHGVGTEVNGNAEGAGAGADANASSACPPAEGFNFGLAAPQTPLPVPAFIEAASVDPEKGFLVTEFKPGAYFVTDGTFNMMFFVAAAGVVVFDAPPSINVTAAVAEATDKPITHVVYSHAHADHIGGAGALARGGGAAVVGAPRVAERLEELQDPLRPVPTVVPEDGETVEVGGVEMTLTAAPYAHDRTTTIIEVPALRTLVVVDILVPDWAPFRLLATTGDVDAYITLHDTMLSRDWDHFLPGHVDRLGTRRDVERNLEYVQFALEAARDAIAENPAGATVAGIPPEFLANFYVVADRIADAQADACYAKVVAAWQGRLGGVDVFARSHCVVLMTYITIDLGG